MSERRNEESQSPPPVALCSLAARKFQKVLGIKSDLKSIDDKIWGKHFTTQLQPKKWFRTEITRAMQQRLNSRGVPDVLLDWYIRTRGSTLQPFCTSQH